MTAPLRGPPQAQLAASLAASQTAPVAEFCCLYTPDIRKKQKKWQDGYLKFHSFNSRVMVYDQARNFLGDTYYKDSNELHEGDELTLDKGVMVQVADAIRVTHTDLAPLFEKKPKEAPPPPSAPPPPGAPPRRFQPPSQVARPQAAPSTTTARANAQQLRHKPLNALLGTPKGPIGKSVPIKSPYEARQEKEREKENHLTVDRAAKRQKTTHASTHSTTLQLSSPVQEKSPALKKSLPPWAKTPDAMTARKPARSIPQGAPVITLDELDAIAHVSSDASLPSTPPAVSKAATPPVTTPAPPLRPAAVAKPALHTPKIPQGKVPVPSVKALETPQAPAPASSPPVSASNRLTNVDFAIQPTPAKEPIRRPSKQPSPPPLVEPPKSPSRNPKAKSLRLSKGVKRGTLMICQPPPPPHLKVPSGVQVTATRPRTSRDSNTFMSDPSLTSETANAAKVASAGLSAAKHTRKATTGSGGATKRARQLPEKSLDAFDDQEVVHGAMDQQLLVSGTPPPEPISIPDSPEQVLFRPKVGKSSAATPRKTAPPKANESGSARVISPPVEVRKASEPKTKPQQKSQLARKTSQPAAPIAEAVQTQSRAASPALSAVSESRSRTASLSPRKLAALSTGGFRKQLKRVAPQSTIPASDKLPPAPRNEIVALPPHPLRANKKGPVMTTTELAAMLRQPKKKPKVTADPIEDDGGASGVSPNRKFRRVRSENDAPIPSASEDWEKRNLPKAAPTDTDIKLIASNEAPEAPAVAARKKSGLAALIKKTDPRKKFVRTRSLTVETSIPPAQETDSPMASPVADKDVGPWSTEAFDLFDWRPPRREEMET